MALGIYRMAPGVLKVQYIALRSCRKMPIKGKNQIFPKIATSMIILRGSGNTMKNIYIKKIRRVMQIIVKVNPIILQIVRCIKRVEDSMSPFRGECKGT